MDTKHRYYLAGSLIRRPALKLIRDRIDDTFTEWTCASRWLDLGDDQPSTQDIALMDAHDLLTSQCMAFVGGMPQSPGKHVALGLAVARGIPVHVIRPDWDVEDDGERCVPLRHADPQVGAGDPR